MAFMKVDLSEENIKDYTGDGSNYLNESGMYEITIKSAIVDTSAKGAESITLWFDHKGQEQPLFQAIRLTNNDGGDNIGKDLFHKLCGIIGMENGYDIPDPVKRNVPMGKKGADKECSVLEDFDDFPIHIRLQMEYGMYNGEIQERKNIRNVFRFEDKASASEIANASDFGKQYEIELEYANKVTYKDGLTEEDIVEWKKNRRLGKTNKEETKKPASGFGKRFGNKPS